mgnify:CR=1 FL=1
MDSQQMIGGHEAGLFQTKRSDFWWIEPLLTGLGFLSFVIYTTWAMFQGNYYWWSAGSEGFGGYLSPFYSRSEERRVGKERRSRWSPYH